ncbi:C40 family peptidase, partial [Xanthomonas oryzae]|uniref:C40 family peptidase n=1 Tax=Xanthomonas oryzae TaxID=347 RepID=UPI0004661711
MARSLLGVPWVHQGRNQHVGIDCVGLLLLAYEIPYDYRGYSTHPHNGLLEHHLQCAFGAPARLERPAIALSDLRVGEVLAMTTTGGRVARHVGLVGDYAYGGVSLIHTDAALGRVVECGLDEATVSNILKVFTPWADLQDNLPAVSSAP